MADFNKFFPTLLRFEGGYVNDPVDPGGATNKGVTFAVFKEHANMLKITPTLDALKRLTDEQAAKIYKSLYWDNIRGDEIPFQPLANIIFDFHVNAGSHAITLFYNVLNAMGSNLHVSYSMDAKAMDVLRHHDVTDVYMHYKSARKGYYIDLAHKHPPLKKFLKGWLNRVDAFPDFPDGKGNANTNTNANTNATTNATTNANAKANCK